MGKHFIEKCKSCKAIISQCGCRDIIKEERWSICAECRKAGIKDIDQDKIDGTRIAEEYFKQEFFEEWGKEERSSIRFFVVTAMTYAIRKIRNESAEEFIKVLCRNCGREFFIQEEKFRAGIAFFCPYCQSHDVIFFRRVGNKNKWIDIGYQHTENKKESNHDKRIPDDR